MMKPEKTIKIPELSLVVLIGTSGSGKSTFARNHFKATEVISSDFCRGLVSDDENSQEATKDAFELLHFIAGKRLKEGKLTVIDATNVQSEARKSLLALAREYDVIPVAIVLDTPETICQERNKQRSDRNFGEHVIRNQRQQLKKSIHGKSLEKEGFRHIFQLKDEQEIAGTLIERQKLWNNLKHDCGPFDLIGDIHGCFDELLTLLEKLGYKVAIENLGNPSLPAQAAENLSFTIDPPENRKVIFLGDLVDRGPKSPEVLKLVMTMVAEGKALCVAGNHDAKLLKKLNGRDVRLTHGLPETLEQLGRESQQFIDETKVFLDSLIGHYVLDDGRLVVAHAGMKETYQGRTSGRVREFGLYGETTGETDEFGLPVRYNWACDYRGKAMVIYGHVPTPEAVWQNNTLCIDTGCVFGGKLTALRYPEKELVEVEAAQEYYKPQKPLIPASQEKTDERDFALLDLNDVIGKRIIETSLFHSITIRQENSAAALEIMSRFAVDPRWLIYLPPTMSPCQTSTEGAFLEEPERAFAYYKERSINKLICQEKHMGSRAIVIVCKNENAAQKSFGISGEGLGVCYTRTGRRFFNSLDIEQEVLRQISNSLLISNFWEEFQTDWLALDCEIMPWSFKAKELIKSQYAAVGACASYGLAQATAVLEKALANGVSCADSLEHFRKRAQCANKLKEAYRPYCWETESLEQYKIAPFHILATQGKCHFDKDHLWHMNKIAGFIENSQSSLLTATRHIEVDLSKEESIAKAKNWWLELTGSGGEGMVIKPFHFINRDQKGLVQPAIKCRGSEYLRIIYGPEYLLEENLKVLRHRSLSTKQALALREFALGHEALQRFVNKEALHRVHECVYGVLALESEPVDPRL